MGYLAVDGDRRIYYEHYAGERTPIVLVHGWGMSGAVWRGIVGDLLAAGHAVVTLDERACGKSDKDFTDVGVKAVAGDVLALVDHLKLERPILNGWSFGGAVVVEAAGQLGDRLGGLVDTNGATPRYTQAPGFPYGGTTEAIAETVAAIDADAATFLAGLSAAVFHADVGQAVVDWTWSTFMETGPAASRSLADLGQVDHRELMPAIAAPALVITGAHDAIVPPEIPKAAAELLPNSRLVEFPDSAHAPFIEERSAYVAELLSFADSI